MPRSLNNLNELPPDAPSFENKSGSPIADSGPVPRATLSDTLMPTGLPISPLGL